MPLRKRDVRKFGFDFHGCIDTHDAVQPFMNFLVNCGHEVHILSGPPMNELKKKLNRQTMRKGVDYTHLFSIVDYLKLVNEPSLRQDGQGKWWADEREWWRTKGIYCLQHNIDFLFDDTAMYEPFVFPSTKFILI